MSEDLEPLQDPTEAKDPLKAMTDNDLTSMEESHAFACPYCGENNSLFIDSSGGRRQQFTSDCEVCCQPIAITMMVEDSAVVEFSAEQESN